MLTLSSAFFLFSFETLIVHFITLPNKYTFSVLFLSLQLNNHIHKTFSIEIFLLFGRRKIEKLKMGNNASNDHKTDRKQSTSKLPSIPEVREQQQYVRSPTVSNKSQNLTELNITSPYNENVRYASRMLNSSSSR